MNASSLASATASKLHISASQQWRLANLTRQKVAAEAHCKDPNLRRLVGLCNTLDCYTSRLEKIHAATYAPRHYDSSIDDDSEDADKEQECADFGEGEVLEWFGDFGNEDAPIPVCECDAKGVEVKVSACGDSDNDSDDSDSCDEDSDASSWRGDDHEQYFSDSSVDEDGEKEKD
jgi:hypothetical protein